jgi:hypothetical protein
MNSSHKVNVIRIKEILPHTNADTLGIVQVGGYQCVVKKDDFKVGDLAVYIQPDSIVPQTEPFKFLWADREFPDGTVPESKRRITVRRFRREWSEGLLLPASSFPELYGAIGEGEWDDVSELLGIKHYVEPEPGFALGAQGRKLTLWQRILKFFGYTPKPYGPKNAPGVYDVESLKNYPRVFTEGEEVLVTEKIHGSNARYVFDGKTFWVGSHKKWWKDQSNIWWEVAKNYPWIEEFCRAWPNYVLRGEVTPTQKGYPYGPDYGDKTEKQLFVFDVQKPDGTYMPKSHLFYSIEMMLRVPQTVPILYKGPYNAEKIKELAEGNSAAYGAKHIREGIVVSSLENEDRVVRGVGRPQLKLKSMAFLAKETK